MFAIRARRKVATERDFLDAVEKVVRQGTKFSSTYVLSLQSIRMTISDPSYAGLCTKFTTSRLVVLVPLSCLYIYCSTVSDYHELRFGLRHGALSTRVIHIGRLMSVVRHELQSCSGHCTLRRCVSQRPHAAYEHLLAICTTMPARHSPPPSSLA